MACLPRFVVPINTTVTAAGERQQWVLHRGDPDDPTATYPEAALMAARPAFWAACSSDFIPDDSRIWS